MNYVSVTILILLSGAFSVALGVVNFKIIDAPSKIMLVLQLVGFLTESVGYYCAVRYRNNLPVYNIFMIVEFFILCCYFDRIFILFVKKNWLLYFGLIGVVLGILNMLFLESVKVNDANFSFFEGFSVIGMCLFGLFKLLQSHEQLRLTRDPHFWFITILLMNFTVGFLNWGLYDIIRVKVPWFNAILGVFMWMVSVLSSIAYGMVFLFYPKMIKANGQ